MKNTIFFLSVIFFLVSCKITKENGSDHLFKLNGSFQISELKEKDIRDQKLTLVLDEATKRVSGFSGCNTYGGSYELSEKEQTIRFSAVFASKRYCVEEEKNSIEQEFLGALSNGFTFSVKKDRIELIAIEDSSIKMQLIKK